jgi:hypothetical protein
MMNWVEAEDLAIAVLGLNEDDDPDNDTIEQAMFEKFEISMEQFQQVADALMPFTIPVKAAISGESFHGFVKDGAFIVKAPVMEQQP